MEKIKVTSSQLDDILASLKTKKKKVEKKKQVENIYELYQGEKYLGTGTAKQLAREFDMPVRSIYNFASQQFHDRQIEGSKGKIAYKRNMRSGEIKKVKYKTITEERADKIVELYFKGYDLKTLLKTI